MEKLICFTIKVENVKNDIFFFPYLLLCRSLLQKIQFKEFESFFIDFEK